jgi:carboxymethylenebutenolidase
MHRVYFHCLAGLVASVIVLQVGLARGADSIATKPVGRMITLSDFGAEDLAYLSIPTTPPTVGIVLVPDAFGLDDFTRLEADRLAGYGYLVLAIDIYNGHQASEPGEIANFVANMNADSVMKTLTAGIRFFHESPKFHADHVIAMGWGAGATYVFQAARDSRTLDGAIIFYGPVETQESRVRKFTVPLCAVYPEIDDVATHENVTAFQHLMRDAGNDFNAWFIAANRGWSNPKSKNYNPAEDREAWKVAMPFIARIGAEPVKPKDDSIIDKAKDKIESMFK